jgi:hypothetical protein
MRDMARKLVELHQSLLQNGAVAEMPQTFDFPFAIQVDEDLQVFANAPDLAQAVSRHIAKMAVLGVTSTAPRVTAVELPRHGRFRIWVDWDVMRGAGLEPGAKRSILYCRKAAFGPAHRIEMMHCTSLSQPAAVTQLRQYIN